MLFVNCGNRGQLLREVNRLVCMRAYISRGQRSRRERTHTMIKSTMIERDRDIGGTGKLRSALYYEPWSRTLICAHLRGEAQAPCESEIGRETTRTPMCVGSAWQQSPVACHDDTAMQRVPLCNKCRLQTALQSPIQDEFGCMQKSPCEALDRWKACTAGFSSIRDNNRTIEIKASEGVWWPRGAVDVHEDVYLKMSRRGVPHRGKHWTSRDLRMMQISDDSV